MTQFQTLRKPLYGVADGRATALRAGLVLETHGEADAAGRQRVTAYEPVGGRLELVYPAGLAVTVLAAHLEAAIERKQAV